LFVAAGDIHGVERRAAAAAGILGINMELEQEGDK
jgi:hypothetical protein